MTCRDEVREAAERIDEVIGYLVDEAGEIHAASTIADALWLLLPDIVDRHMSATTQVVRRSF